MKRLSNPETIDGSLPESARHPSFGEAFLFRLKLGFISFGGPTGQIAVMELYPERVNPLPLWLSARTAKP